MELKWMTEGDLAGVLFAEFPLAWSLERSRETLEGMVRREGWSELSPGSVFSALSGERQRIVERWPPEVRWRRLSEKERALLRRCAPEWAAERDRAAGLNVEDWSFE